MLTTVTQVASRFLLMWGVTFLFPSVAMSRFYSSMLLAWSFTEVVRYSYFALMLSGWEPKLLVWLRYNGFFVLYPIGITSELVLLYYAASGPAGPVMGEWYKVVLYCAMLTYIPGKHPLSVFGRGRLFTDWAYPGSPVLYGHMMKQRAKVLRQRQSADRKDN